MRNIYNIVYYPLCNFVLQGKGDNPSVVGEKYIIYKGFSLIFGVLAL